jgi:hypothetical protein
LLPKIRDAKLDEVIVADGFSCKTQIEQGGTGRRALHLAQVMQMAREHGASGPPPKAGRPEDPYYLKRPKAPLSLKAKRAAIVAGVAATLAGAALSFMRRDR